MVLLQTGIGGFSAFTFYGFVIVQIQPNRGIIQSATEGCEKRITGIYGMSHRDVHASFQNSNAPNLTSKKAGVHDLLMC